MAPTTATGAGAVGFSFGNDTSAALDQALLTSLGVSFAEAAPAGLERTTASDAIIGGPLGIERTTTAAAATPIDVPEPPSLAVLAMAVAACCAYGRRSRMAAATPDTRPS